jgi:hypothetical protein
MKFTMVILAGLGATIFWGRWQKGKKIQMGRSRAGIMPTKDLFSGAFGARNSVDINKIQCRNLSSSEDSPKVRCHLGITEGLVMPTLLGHIYDL